MTTENQAPEGAPAAAIQPLPQAEFDALMDHIYEHGTMAEGITARARAMCEAYARAALAAQRQAAPVALTDIDLCRLISAHEVYQYHPGALHEFADAVIAEFCRVNDIPAPKEPTNER